VREGSVGWVATEVATRRSLRGVLGVVAAQPHPVASRKNSSGDPSPSPVTALARRGAGQAGNALEGCRRMFFCMSVSPSYLEVAATVATVARLCLAGGLASRDPAAISVPVFDGVGTERSRRLLAPSAAALADPADNGHRPRMDCALVTGAGGGVATADGRARSPISASAPSARSASARSSSRWTNARSIRLATQRRRPARLTHTASAGNAHGLD
jgi:hypothetical protein